MQRVVSLQEELDLDLLVHGEPEVPRSSYLALSIYSNSPPNQEVEGPIVVDSSGRWLLVIF